MINHIKNNISVLWKYFVGYYAALFSVLEIITFFMSFEDIGIVNKKSKITIFCISLGIAIFLSIMSIFLRRKKKLFGNMNQGLTIRYGDLMKTTFNNKKGKKKIIVIHVNRCFDLSCEGNLIRESSIHGQFIDKYIDNEDEKEKLHNYIESNLKNRNIEFETLSRKDKKLGYLKRYPEGTVVEVKGDNDVTFYLLALSKLDDNLIANCTELEFYNSLSKLLVYYDSYGQGADLYCAIMGDKIVKPHRETKEIIDFMISVFKFNNNAIRGNINLVVYGGLKSTISILDY
ncbi:MAG: DUF6430 domain-containing protein [Clostridiales bacterium]|nr:DUF6430 domain-containing protein [Clostridiales bacterium]